ncbi:MAG: hypothetical protein MUE44_04350 [Oscillatoriaceae cyanobacterium Prado104]|nr:hypothetical protein [Oscillatoriaceae cyanobacterium Prado104]
MRCELKTVDLGQLTVATIARRKKEERIKAEILVLENVESFWLLEED